MPGKVIWVRKCKARRLRGSNLVIVMLVSFCKNIPDTHVPPTPTIMGPQQRNPTGPNSHLNAMRQPVDQPRTHILNPLWEEKVS